MTSEGIGGIAATDQWVVVGSRDLLDTSDVFTCHRMADGVEVWRITYPAPGKLDYGNSPRATPVIHGRYVILQSAFGQLTVADLSTGEIVWQTHFQFEYGAQVPTWGFSGSPLVANLPILGRNRYCCIVQPGAEDASLVALDLASGDLVWQSPGRAPSYSSFISVEQNGQVQLVGYDDTTLGGWDSRGQRIWTVTPPASGDFNVPTPIVWDQRLCVSTENNGTRLYEFDATGKLDPTPRAAAERLNPDTQTPVRVGELICGVSSGLHCLSIEDLAPVHTLEDPAFDDYAALISDGRQRVLVTTLAGELVLVEATTEACRIIDRLKLTGQAEILAHPALVGNDLIVRFGRTLACLPLSAGEH